MPLTCSLCSLLPCLHWNEWLLSRLKAVHFHQCPSYFGMFIMYSYTRKLASVSSLNYSRHQYDMDFRLLVGLMEIFTYEIFNFPRMSVFDNWLCKCAVISSSWVWVSRIILKQTFYSILNAILNSTQWRFIAITAPFDHYFFPAVRCRICLRWISFVHNQTLYN